MKTIFVVMLKDHSEHLVSYSHESQAAVDFFHKALSNQSSIMHVRELLSTNGRIVEAGEADSASLIASLLAIGNKSQVVGGTVVTPASVVNVASVREAAKNHAEELLACYDDAYKYVIEHPEVTPQQVASALRLHIHDAGALLVKLENDGKLYRPHDRRHYAVVPTTGVVRTFQHEQK